MKVRNRFQLARLLIKNPDLKQFRVWPKEAHNSDPDPEPVLVAAPDGAKKDQADDVETKGAKTEKANGVKVTARQTCEAKVEYMGYREKKLSAPINYLDRFKQLKKEEIGSVDNNLPSIKDEEEKSEQHT